jgi:hypothetical protein
MDRDANGCELARKQYYYTIKKETPWAAAGNKAVILYDAEGWKKILEFSIK